MNPMQTNATSELAKDYISKRNINSLFEALMTGLMVHKPDDHIQFLMDALQRCKDSRQPVKWDTFVSRKGGMNNVLPPVPKPTDTNTNTNLKPSFITEFNQTPKISPIGQDKQQQPKENKDVLKGKPIIFISGGPGSGKGTQCEKLIEKYGFTHLSIGDLIRAAAQDSKSDKGRYFNDMMAQGKLISTEDILSLLKDALYEKANQSTGFIIDGFPRKIDQGIQFEQEVAQCSGLLYFDVPDEVLTERLVKRGETSGRIDDNEETIKKRLKTFHEETTPILGYYGKQGKLVTIDGDRDPDEVFDDVVQELERLIQSQLGFSLKPAEKGSRRDPRLDKFKGKKVIFVVGGPGSGKGTQCERIVQRYGYTHLSTGDLLREAVQSKTERGEQLNALMKEGKLVPMETVLDLLKEKMLEHVDETKGFLIDGYPREVPQAKKFEELIAPCTIVLYVNASEETMTKRLLHRGQSSGRIDDNEETIKKRLKTFQNQTIPVLDYYEMKQKLVEVDSELPPDDVFIQVREALDNLDSN